MTTPTVSVALCTRDGARFVEQQVQSILTQSWPIDELVVGDDTSSDDTVDIVRRTVHRIAPRVPLTITENPTPLGVTGNFAAALATCRSHLVALSDQDDVWHPDRIALAVERFRSDPGLALLHADARLVDVDGAPMGETLFGALEVTDHDLDEIDAGRAFGVLLRRNLATGATVMLRRSLLEVALPIPSDWVHDEWLAIVAAATARVGVLRRPVIDYRQHGGNQIGAARPTLRQKIARVRLDDPGRNDRLALRFDELRVRLDAVGGDTAAAAVVRRKVEHERARAALPRRRIARLPGIFRELGSGRYSTYSSRGRLDAVRDLVRTR